MPIDIAFQSDSDMSRYTTKIYSDQNYINVEGDKLQGNLNLNNHKLINVGNPTDSSDCSTKSYVDLKISPINENLSALNVAQTKFAAKNYVDTQISAMNRLFSEALSRVKFKLIVGMDITIPNMGNSSQFDYNFFIQSVWYLGADGRTWLDSRSDQCKKMKVNFKTNGLDLVVSCSSLPMNLTGDCVILLKRDVITPITEVGIPQTRPTGLSNIGIVIGR